MKAATSVTNSFGGLLVVVELRVSNLETLSCVSIRPSFAKVFFFVRGICLLKLAFVALFFLIAMDGIPQQYVIPHHL